MRTTALRLEAFDPGEDEAEAAQRPRAVPTPAGPTPEELVEGRIARARGEGRAEGFAEGVAEAEARGLAELRLIAADLREQILDARLALTARRAEELDHLRAVAVALLAGVAPALAQAGLAAEVAEAAIDALRRPAGARVDGQGDIRVRVSPDQCAAVAAALDRLGVDVVVTPDPTLGDLHARLDWGDGEDVIDLDAALHAAHAAIERHLNPELKVRAHG